MRKCEACCFSKPHKKYLWPHNYWRSVDGIILYTIVEVVDVIVAGVRGSITLELLEDEALITTTPIVTKSFCVWNTSIKKKQQNFDTGSSLICFLCFSLVPTTSTLKSLQTRNLLSVDMNKFCSSKLLSNQIRSFCVKNALFKASAEELLRNQ